MIPPVTAFVPSLLALSRRERGTQYRFATLTLMQVN